VHYFSKKGILEYTLLVVNDATIAATPKTATETK